MTITPYDAQLIAEAFTYLSRAHGLDDNQALFVSRLTESFPSCCSSLSEMLTDVEPVVRLPESRRAVRNARRLSRIEAIHLRRKEIAYDADD